MARAFAEIAFTPAVRKQQGHNGSRHYADLLSDDRHGGDRLGDAERFFVEDRDGFYQATVSETGWPYVQFRGGARGFLRVIDERTIAYADLRGNRQYISVGNLDGNDRVCLILMDYPNARRLKIWGRAVTFESDVIDADGADGQAERIVVIHIEAFDWNCPRHIPRRYTAEEAETEMAVLRQKNAALQAEATELRRRLAQGASV
ncbi:pyridoxamine 5'-phosphate oxidase family protein [Rhodobacteraceae bacterium F11138]|nr:pyridoxamine 5'-phosphate oxidase family protein [Rhodobacteraceae bacterium F11138]